MFTDGIYLCIVSPHGQVRSVHIAIGFKQIQPFNINNHSL